jgi:hypothetical protein
VREGERERMGESVRQMSVRVSVSVSVSASASTIYG